MKALLLIPLIVLSWSLSAMAAGGVQGTVVLDSQRPPAVDAGYKPKTVKPIEGEEPGVAIVWLETSTGDYPQTRTGEVVKIQQRGYQFRPSLVALQKGASAEFPNGDDEFHNVFSYSKIRRFDLGRFRKNEPSPRIQFDKAGLVKIYCEIHQHMRCRVLVLDTPWFAVTDAQGRFKISGVPAGSYQIKALLPSEKTVQGQVTVTEGKTASAQLSR
ncbi:carboxypeptidase regulatory-like domain-containing protein [Prosthecobacter dejongeii]|uniref:Plastocyanin n=1 Tax=Prosthecobacter dejongeii TaxID=48465 RepID=A0A7W7YHJ6_9BACT|nr:carboxypeptidase regulatory-like domain-containing protein [Prosthecobacter dejongeii]MBB5036239.1 plastocyanin [Prosthecobacter dejongeii]